MGLFGDITRRVQQNLLDLRHDAPKHMDTGSIKRERDALGRHRDDVTSRGPADFAAPSKSENRKTAKIDSRASELNRELAQRPKLSGSDSIRQRRKERQRSMGHGEPGAF